MKELNTLPSAVIEKVKKVLRAYDEVNVIYEYGEFHVSPGLCIKSTYGNDHEFIGTYKADEVFTPEERILNYVNSFQDYPIEYKGKRNYKDFQTGKRETFKWENGNIVIA